MSSGHRADVQGLGFVIVRNRFAIWRGNRSTRRNSRLNKIMRKGLYRGRWKCGKSDRALGTRPVKHLGKDRFHDAFMPFLTARVIPPLALLRSAR